MTAVTEKAEALSEPVADCEGPCGRTLGLTDTVVVPVELESGRTIAVTLCEQCAPNDLPDGGI